MKIWYIIGELFSWHGGSRPGSPSLSRLPNSARDTGVERADDVDDLRTVPSVLIHLSVGQYLEDQLAYASNIAAELEQERARMLATQRRFTERREWERRGIDGALTVFRVVRVANDGDEGLARCRNISDTGMKLDLSMSLALHDPVEVAFSPSVSLGGRVVWRHGLECGIAFGQQVDSLALLSTAAAEALAEGARPPRLKANLPATVAVGSNSHHTMIGDISQHGMKLTHDGSFHVGLHVRVLLATGKGVEGVVRWAKDDTAGVYLPQPFSVMDLGSIRSLASSQISNPLVSSLA